MSTKTKVKLVIIVLCIVIWSIAITSLLLKNGHVEQIEDTVTDPTRKFIITTTTQMDYQWIDKYTTEEPKNGIEYVQDYYDSLLCIFQGENCVYDYSGFDTIPPSWINEYSPCQGMEYNSTLLFYSTLYCIRPTWLNDGYCDEECNTPDFNYDGGDCCLDIVNNAKCIDCYCYKDCSVHPLKFNDDEDFQIESECYEPKDLDPEDCMVLWLGDGLCDDGCNNHLFDFDHQDCCLEDVADISYCNECICYANCTGPGLATDTPVIYQCQGMGYNESLLSTMFNTTSTMLLLVQFYYCTSTDFWINDGFCDEECNAPDFNYDGGDCCLDIVNNAKCIDCYCYEDCSTHQLRFIDGIDLQPEVDCYEHSDHDWNSCPYSWLNDGLCDDECNHDLFDYDLNDCCLKDSNYMYCEDCICYANCTKMPLDWQSIFGQ